MTKDSSTSSGDLLSPRLYRQGADVPAIRWSDPRFQAGFHELLNPEYLPGFSRAGRDANDQIPMDPVSP
jgi:hypothetical protein